MGREQREMIYELCFSQEYLARLRQIRLQNFNERQQIKARLRGEKVCAPTILTFLSTVYLLLYHILMLTIIYSAQFQCCYT